MDFLKLKYNAFGLDINDFSVKIAKLEKKDGKLQLVSFGRQDLELGAVDAGVIKDEKAVSEVIKATCSNAEGKKLDSKYVFFSLPEEESFLQVIQMPKMSQQELETAVPFEAENYIPLPIDQMCLDFQIISSPENNPDRIDVLVAACPKKVVDSYVSCIKSAGLAPLCAEVESQSIARALVKNETSGQALAIVDIGRDNADFIVFSGNSVRFTYSISMSQNQLTLTIARSLKVSAGEAEKLKKKYGLSGFDEKAEGQAKKIFQAISPFLEEFAIQIEKSIDFCQSHSSHERALSEGEIKKIILCGGGADLKGLAEFVSKRTGLPTEIGDPCSGSSIFLPFTTALGLAAGAINFEEEKND